MNSLAAIATDRDLLRVVHGAFAFLLGVALYAPVGDGQFVDVAVRGVAFPGLAVTGALMWQAGALRRRLATRRDAGGSDG